jgi:hypothetical protein
VITWGGPPLSMSCRRSAEMEFCTCRLAVDGGLSSHTASTRCASDTTRSDASSMTASSRCCRCPTRRTERPWALACNGPKMRNSPLSQYQFQFGYPTVAPFNGQLLTYCTGTSFNDGGHNGIYCNMTEGASGGPWLDGFNGTFGWLDSVNSWVSWNSAGVRFKWNGPYFGNNAADLFNNVANL